MGRNWRRGTAILALAAIPNSAARADAIDGTWCSGDGRYFSIAGPTIVTNDGAKIQGNYSRHAFSYTIPSPDRWAGAQVFMILLNEVTVRLKIGRDPATPTEIWKRCDVTS
jgi:hypothetical protein